MPVKNATSSFEKAFAKTTDLAEYLTKHAQENKTDIADDLKLNSLERKLAYFIDKILNYKINNTNQLYRQFSDNTKTQLYSNIYLTRIVAVVNKLATALNNMTMEENTDLNQSEIEKLNADLKIVKNIFRRKAPDAIAIYYDVFTDILWKNDTKYTLVDAMDLMCNDLKEKDSNRSILVEELRTSIQLCAKHYKYIFGQVQDSVKDDYEDTRLSLLNFVNILKDNDEEQVIDIFDFLRKR